MNFRESCLAAFVFLCVAAALFLFFAGLVCGLAKMFGVQVEVVCGVMFVVYVTIFLAIRFTYREKTR